MTRYSILDLAPVPEGETVADALRHTVALAREAEELGYHRFWLAEHHGMQGVASAATSVVIGHVAGATRRIRVGAGGVMLPNHAPLVIAEHYGTLATLYPDRIDLGVGRAPGTDPATTRALRRTLAAAGQDSFPQDVMELIAYFEPATQGQAVRAVPGEGTRVPVWILGSSLYGAQLAAALGLPYAFASHFAPAALAQAVTVYRERFRPSRHLAEPYLMLAFNVFAAATDAEGEFLKSSMQQAFSNLRTGKPSLLPRPVRDIEARLDPRVVAGVAEALSCSVAGSPETVRAGLRAFLERYRPHELMLTGQIHDQQARLRSFAIAAEVLDSLARDAG